MQEIARSPENPRRQPSNSPHIFNPINVLGVQSQIFISVKPRFSTRCPSQTNCPWQSHPKWPSSTPPTETKSPWFTSLYCNSGETQCRWLTCPQDHRRNQRFRKCHSVSSAPSAAFRTPSPSPSRLSLRRLLSVSPATVSFVPSYHSPSVPHFPTEPSPFSIAIVFRG